jgi:hypothetical protein
MYTFSQMLSEVHLTCSESKHRYAKRQTIIMAMLPILPSPKNAVYMVITHIQTPQELLANDKCRKSNQNTYLVPPTLLE